MRVYLVVVVAALMLAARPWPAAASVGEANRPATACTSDGDCPPGYWCTSMVYRGVSIMPICIAGPTNCTSDGDCPLGYRCDKGSWFSFGESGQAHGSGSCSPGSTARVRGHRSSAPN